MPFLACGDLSGFDADMTYQDVGPLLEPVQMPIDPPYKKASGEKVVVALSGRVNTAKCPPLLSFLSGPGAEEDSGRWCRYVSVRGILLNNFLHLQRGG